MKRCRRAAFVALVGMGVMAGALPAVAASPESGKWTDTYVQSGYDLKFEVKGGKIKKIAGHVLEYCDGSTSSSTTTFAPDSSWKVKGSGKFSGRHKESSGGVTVYFTFEGKFTSKNKAEGVLREESIVAGSTCDTYELDWKAKRA